MPVMLYLILSHYSYRTFIQTCSATSPFNPHWEMDKTFSPSYSSSQITYAEAVEFSRFRFHRKRTASTSLLCAHAAQAFPIATKWFFDQHLKVVLSSAFTQRTCDRCGSL